MITKDTIKAEIHRYYLKGLTAKEIGKLTDLSARSVQRYIQELKCSEEPKEQTRQTKALQLHAKGFSYAEIAKKLRVCKTTVYLWCKKAKQVTE